MNVIHRFVIIIEPTSSVCISFEHNTFSVLRELHRNASHLGEIAAHIARYRGIGVPAATDARDMSGKGTHALQVGHVAHAAENGPQITGDRSLTSQDGEGIGFQYSAFAVDIVTAVDDMFGRYNIRVQQRLGGLLHHDGGVVAQIGDTAGQSIELLMKDSPHDQPEYVADLAILCRPEVNVS